MVTAELAVGLLVVAVVLAGCAWVVSLVVEQTCCADVAAQVARQLARGDQAAAQDAQRKAPSGASVSINQTSSIVTVTLRVSERFGRLGEVPLVGAASMPLEPGVTR